MALLSQAQLTRPPVDLDMCARVAGVQLVAYADLGTQSALLSLVEGIVAVVVNSKHGRTRQRFSLAHEVGHWILERTPVTHDLRPIAARGRAYSAVERVCDYFAASLLMPREWVRARAEDGRTNEELAQLFDVSPPAMIARLRELGYYSRRCL
jgi:Zn-dependent peptidase ImmA (M78 family)